MRFIEDAVNNRKVVWLAELLPLVISNKVDYRHRVRMIRDNFNKQASETLVVLSDGDQIKVMNLQLTASMTLVCRNQVG